MHEFPHPKQRIRRVLDNALGDCTYIASTTEDSGSRLLLQARRPDGRRVNIRFRGVKESEASDEPSFGSAIRVRKVGSADKFSLLGMLFPLLRAPGPTFARVTIDAGEARLRIVCQDAEWWEDEASPD